MSTQNAAGYQPDPAPPDHDALKDADNLVFLAGLPADERDVWLERCRLLRWVDQLAERDRCGWQAFLRQWRHIEWGFPAAISTYEDQIEAMGRLWLRPDGDWPFAGRRYGLALSSWLDALSADYGRSTVPRTLEEHDQMLLDVGGFFRLFPYLTPEQWESIEAFGALDQAWNNVRDIAEDALSGRRLIPEAELDRHGVRGFMRDYVMAGHMGATLQWRNFMCFWLGEHLPTLRERARPFIEATDLHPSVAAMRACCLRRYERVERVLRAVDFDYRAFPEVYAAEVRRELGEMAMGGGANEVA